MSNLNDDNNTTKTISKLFSGLEKIRIPSYQRAYSWEGKHCSQFFEDLLEQKGKKYYLGQLLFEKIGNDLFIIDGQQRLTTTIIFISSGIKLLKQRGINTDILAKKYLTDIFNTVSDDQVLFERVTQSHFVSSMDDTETLSQKRIIKAFLLFEEKLNKFNNEDIQELCQTLEDAVIMTSYVSSKIEATQVFEYQNNRGKDLSRFEIIKAYLMHQVYIQSNNQEQANNEISEIQNIISYTYRRIESVEGYFTENELLDNYCNLFYKIDGNITELKEKLKKEDNKITWIKNFFKKFAEIAHSAKTIVANKWRTGITNLFFVGNEANWKLVLLTVFYKSETSHELFEKILKSMEVLCFKLKLGDYRTDYLPNYAKRYFNEKDAYNIENLHNEIKDAAEFGFKWYWNDGDRFKNIILNYFDNEKYHYNRNTIKFVLWQYENALRNENRAGALLDKDLYDNYTIEHIAPQNPANETYTDDFKNNFLHIAGNLALLTQSQNSKFSNKSFTDKVTLFQDTALSSYTEIRVKNQWSENEITERHERISSFAKQYFYI